MTTDKKFFTGFALGLLVLFAVAATPIKDLVLQNSMDAGGHTITNLATSTNLSSAATRAFVTTNSANTNYASSSQGVKADSALQPGTAITNVAGLQSSLDAKLAATNGTAANVNLTGTTQFSGTVAGDSVTKSVGTGSNNVAPGDLSGNIAGGGVTSVRNGATPFALGKYASWTTGGGGSMPPIRILLMGDSLATGLQLSQNMQISGVYGSGAVITSGTAGATSQTNQFTLSLNGLIGVFPPGSRGVYKYNAQSFIQGDRGEIAYIRYPGGPSSFDVEYTLDNEGTWVTGTTVTNGQYVSGTIGGIATISIPSSNSPFVALRINNVVSGTLKVPYWGIRHENGGGVISIRGIADTGGIDVTQSAQVLPDVLSSHWANLAPDIVISRWADSASYWDSGGAWRTFYSALKAAYANTDFVQVSMNPESAGEEIPKAQALAQWRWAEESDELFVDGYSIFRNYAKAAASGMMADVVHLSARGNLTLNMHLWDSLIIGRLALGRGAVGNTPTGAPPSQINEMGAPGFRMGSGSLWAGALLYASNPLAVPGSIAIFQSSYSGTGTLWNSRRFTVVNNGDTLDFGRAGSSTFLIRQAGIENQLEPGSDGQRLGGNAKRWAPDVTRIRIAEGDSRKQQVVGFSSGTATVTGTATFVTGSSAIYPTMISGTGTSTAIPVNYSYVVNSGTSLAITALKADGTTETGFSGTLRFLITDQAP